MNTDSAKRWIDLLKIKLHKTRSNKSKVFYMADILSLEHFVRINEPEYSSMIFGGDFVYLKYRDKVLKERHNTFKHIIDSNKENEMIANHLLSEYEEAKFIPFLFDRMEMVDKKRSYELLKDFMGYMGPLAYKKYNELIKDESILTRPSDDYGGICWDFPSINKQVVESNEDNGIYNLMALAHEIGHAVHFDKLNGMGRRRIEHNSLVESMSMLFEEEFIDFGLKNGMGFDILRNYVYSQRIPEALSVKIASALVDKDMWSFNGNTIIFDEVNLEAVDMQNDYYAYLANKLLSGLEYIEPLYYVLGFTLTEKLRSMSLRGKEALNEMLEILLRSELYSHKENLESLDLIHFDFPSLKDNLIKNSNNVVLKK